MDHPLCEDCAKSLIEDLETALRQSEDDNKGYEGFLRTMDEERGDTAGVDQALRACRQEEKELRRQLEELEQERVETEVQFIIN